MNGGARFRRPAMLDPAVAAQIPGALDAAARADLAHRSAAAVVARARATSDPAVVERLVNLVTEDGIEAIAELWQRLPADTLPGTLYRLYALQQWVIADGEAASVWYRLGMGAAAVANAVAGVVDPPTPEHLRLLVDDVLSGFFTGDLAVALERAAAFALVVSTGVAFDADSRDATDPALGSAFTASAANLRKLSEGFTQAARLWRADALE